MNSEKVKEIKEALAQNSGYIPFFNEYEAWDDVAYADILTLINELESENERLKEYRKNHSKTLARIRSENTELKDRIAELETQNEVLCVELSRYTENCIEMKNCTLKQFAERLKEKCNDKNTFICSNSITATEIDETLKEMIEDDK